MSGFLELFDSYNRKARLIPGLLTVFSPLLALLAWFPELIISSVGATLFTLASSCGLLFMIASLARTRGREVERRLLKEWGGWPTTILLRHNCDRLDSHTRERYHKFLAANVPGLHMPTAAEEAANLASADKAYSSAVMWLKERTRRAGFSLVEGENAQYGFRRNLFGMKPIGIFGSLVTFALAIWAILMARPEFLSALYSGSPSAILAQVRLFQPTVMAALVVNVLALIGWIFFVTGNWVKEGGFQYATALLATCDKLSQKVSD